MEMVRLRVIIAAGSVAPSKTLKKISKLLMGKETSHPE